MYNCKGETTKFQFAFVGGDNMVSVTDSLQSPLAGGQAILQQGNLTFTLGDQSQQVFVITDPAQLEVLQVGDEKLACLKLCFLRLNLSLKRLQQ